MNIEINNGVVTKDGEVIGTIQDGTCHLLAKVGPTVKGAIKKASDIDGLAFVVGDTPDDKSTLTIEKIQEAKALLDASEAEYLVLEKESIIADLSDDELAAEMRRRGLIQEAPAVEPAASTAPVVAGNLSGIERLQKLADEGRIPQPPVKHPAMGDKTPEFVTWFRTYATPEEFAVRYPDNRRLPGSHSAWKEAQLKITGKLPGEKKDTGKENDFTDSAE